MSHHIPKYFYRLFSTIQSIEQHFNLTINDLLIPEEEKISLRQLSSEILIVTTRNSEIHSTGTLWEIKDTKYKRNDDININKVIDNLGAYLMTNKSLENVFVAGCSMVGRYNNVKFQAKFKNAYANQIKNERAWSVLLNCVGEDAFCRMMLDSVVLCRLPHSLFYQLAGKRLDENAELNQVNIVKTDVEEIRNASPSKKRSNDYDHKIESRKLAKLCDDRLPLIDMAYHSKLNTKKRTREGEDVKLTKLSRRQKKKQRLEKEAVIAKDAKSKRKFVDNGSEINRKMMYYGNTVMSQKTREPSMIVRERCDLQNSNSRSTMQCIKKIFPHEFSEKKPKKGDKFLARFSQIEQLIKNIHYRHTKISAVALLNAKCPKKDHDIDVASAACRYNDVTEFMILQLKRVFPLRFWGSEHNLQVIYHAIKHLVSRRKNETITLNEIKHKFKVTECLWLAPASNTSRVVPSDIERRTKVISQALTWVFNGYIIPVINSMFYVTEHAKYPQKMYYFRRDVWHKLTQPKIESIISSAYAHCDINTLINSKIGTAKLRLLPKDDGFRYITNYKHTLKYGLDPRTRQLKSTNSSSNKELQHVLKVLNFEEGQNPELTGSSVLDRGSLFKKFKEYKSDHFSRGDKFYFVKADITNCFDNIDPEKLLSLLDDILQDGNYIFKTVSTCYPFQNQMRSKEFVFAGTSKHMDSIAEFSSKTKGIPRNSILIDKNTYYKKKVIELRDLVRESVQKNTVTIGGHNYIRSKGIAQGSCLSTILCSLFFGDLEKDKGKLSFVKRDKDGLLLTYVDDFLYITKSLSYAKWFSNAVIHELKKVGIMVNKDKCLSNINVNIDEFSWLGYKFNTHTLDIYLDTPKSDKDICKSLTTEFSRSPGKSLHNKCIRNIKSQYHDILFSNQVNSKQAIERNLYQIFYNAAIKLVQQARVLSKSIVGFINQDHLFEIILTVYRNIGSMQPSCISAKRMLQLFLKAFNVAFHTRKRDFPLVAYRLSKLSW